MCFLSTTFPNAPANLPPPSPNTFWPVPYVMWLQIYHLSTMKINFSNAIITRFRFLLAFAPTLIPRSDLSESTTVELVRARCYDGYAGWCLNSLGVVVGVIRALVTFWKLKLDVSDAYNKVKTLPSWTKILLFLIHRTPIPQIWCRYDPHPVHILYCCLVVGRKILVGGGGVGRRSRRI